MAKSKKQSHTQRLMDSMRTLGTARTPISNAYQSGKDRDLLPKDVKSENKGSRGQSGKILVPEKLTRQDRPSPVTNPGTPNPTQAFAAANRYNSYGAKGWDTRHPNYLAERSAYNLAVANYNTYSRQLTAAMDSEKAADTRDIERAIQQSKQATRKIARGKNGAKKAMSRLKSSRGGLGRAGGMRGGSRR
jgi:hypothetical protein